MTPDQIAAIEARLKAAIDEPWEFTVWTEKDRKTRNAIETAVTKSFNDIAALLSEVRALQGEVERLRGALELIGSGADEAPDGAFNTAPPQWAMDSFNNDDACSCGYCGAWMEVVRPGKVQCCWCGDGTNVRVLAHAALTPAPSDTGKGER